MKDISVIIPCFNGWKYMSKCLNAFESQIVAPAEIIIVDDCSTDDSFERLEEYKNKSNLNIVLLKNEKNLGPGISRKQAIDIALGDYISFCDCDDWYELDFLKTINEKIDLYENIDVIIFDYFISCSERRLQARSTFSFIKSDKPEILANAKMSLCCFVVKKEIMQSVVCPPLYYGEDGAIIPQIIAKAKHIAVLETPLYNYYYREGSASVRPSPRAYIDLAESFRVVKSELPEEFQKECEYIGIKYVCYGAVLSAFKAGIDLKKIVPILNDFEKKFPDWISNKYIRNLGKVKNMYLFFIKKRMFLLVKLMSSLHDFYIKLKRK